MSIEIKEMGLCVKGEVTMNELRDVLTKLAENHNAMTWQLADLIVLYEDVASDRTAIRKWLGSKLHIKVSTVYRMGYTARRIPINLRRAAYSYSAHKIAAKASEDITEKNIDSLLQQALAMHAAETSTYRRRGLKHAVLTGEIPTCLNNGKGVKEYANTLRNARFDKVCGIIESATRVFQDKKKSGSTYTDEQKARLKAAYETIYAKYTELVAEQCTRQIF